MLDGGVESIEGDKLAIQEVHIRREILDTRLSSCRADLFDQPPLGAFLVRLSGCMMG